MSSPFTIESFTTKTNKVDLVDASHVNALQTSVVNIETGLNRAINNDGSLCQGTSFPGSPVAGQIFYRTDTDTLYVRNGANSAWQAIFQPYGIPNNMQVFTASGTWTRPANVSKVLVKVIGAGGSGGANSSSGSVGGAGGGGGGYSEGVIDVTGNVTVTIGATNSFAGSTTIQATSGGNASTSTPGTGGAGSGGTINVSGTAGGAGSLYQAGDGGNSPIGSGGIAGSNNAGNNGGSYGGGGGGGGISGGANYGGGSGDAGAVIVYWAS